MKNSFEECAPQAGAMISSLRALGYDFATAIADLIDNSLYAQAKNISVDYAWHDGDPWFRITDDGHGMTERSLKNAMRLGSKSPLDEREQHDLGRFGLGLKTAAFSQGKLLIVRSKTTRRNAVIRCWDLEHVEKNNKWELSLNPPKSSEGLLDSLDDLDHGTVVLCKNLDRLVSGVDDPEAEDNFLEKFSYVARYLEMVFHRFLSGRQKVRIRVGAHECVPWDPFLESNEFTQKQYTETIRPDSIKITPFVLPYHTKQADDEHKRGSGLYGWNAHQGFYVYRNKRMIVPGGYLDFNLKSEEHHKLCRIRVDLPNSVDHEWGIDVRKASASPPSHVRKDLERIAKSTRVAASEIYRARTDVTDGKRTRTSREEVWSKKRKGEKIVFHINRDNAAIARLIKKHDLKQSLVSQLFHIIENSVPHQTIVIENSRRENCLVDLPPVINQPPADLLELCVEIFRGHLKRMQDPNEAVKQTLLGFPRHVAYRAHLDALIEETKNER